MPLTLRSTVNDDQTLRLDLVDAPMATPGPDEVVIRVDAVPINPSDVGPLLGGADPRTVSVIGDGADRVATFDIPDAAWPVVAPRAGKALTFGNEGCGVVVDAGSSAEAQALVGKPQVLIADELSLGLAPVIVSRLVEALHLIVAGGTGVLLIEQFTTVALQLANTASLMERGSITWSGPAGELQENPDLLHQAYLAGDFGNSAGC